MPLVSVQPCVALHSTLYSTIYLAYLATTSISVSPPSWERRNNKQYQIFSKLSGEQHQQRNCLITFLQSFSLPSIISCKDCSTSIRFHFPPSTFTILEKSVELFRIMSQPFTLYPWEVTGEGLTTSVAGRQLLAALQNQLSGFRSFFAAA